MTQQNLDTDLDSYLAVGGIMQLATIHNGAPHVCSVYFVAGQGRHLYWLSLPDQRHSQDIAQNPKVAVAIVVKPDLPVIGLQIQGSVQTVTELKEVEDILAKYVARHGSGKQFVERFKAGTSKHWLYKLQPDRIEIFDDTRFGERAQVVVGGDL